MADTATSSLKIRKQASGANFNTWGDLLNTDALDLLDEAIAKQVTVTLEGNYLIPDTSYETNVSRHPYIIFIDNGLSSAPTVTAPPIEKWWWIKNAGSTYAITFGVSGGVSVEIPAGKTVAIFCDGIDCEKVDLSNLGGTAPLDALPSMQTGKVLGNMSGTASTPDAVAVLDEDDMSSNSATSLATQQSIKAYIDTLASSGNLAAVAAIADEIVTVANDSADIEAIIPYTNEITTVAQNITDVATVGGEILQVVAVANISTQVVTVASDSADIQALGPISADIAAVSAISADVTAVANDASDIGSVAANISDVAAVSGSLTPILAVSNITNEVTTVAGISTDVEAVAGIAGNVTTAATNAASINAVAANESDIDAVAAIATDVTAVANNTANISAVAGISGDVSQAAAISTDIQAVSTINSDVTTVANIAPDITTVAQGIETSIPALMGDVTFDMRADHKSGLIDPDRYFRRASSATYFDSQGVLRTAAPDEPRIDHDPVTGECRGLLREGQSTNLLTHSEAFDNAVWIKQRATVSANAATAPDGTTTMDKLVDDTNTGEHYIQRAPVGLSAGGIYTYSISVKADEYNRIRLRIYSNPTTSDSAILDCTLSGEGTLTPSTTGNATIYSQTIELGKDGIYRISLTYSLDNSDTSALCRPTLINNSSQHSYTGDGTSGLYIWGAQLEAQSFASSYIKTEAAAVTRAADVYQITDMSWYDQSGGTIYCEFDADHANPHESTIFSLSDGTGNNCILSRPNPEGWTTAYIETNDIVQATLRSANYQAGTVGKIALRFAKDDIAVSLNGSPVVTDQSLILPLVDRLQIGSGPVGHNKRCHFKRFIFSKTRVPNASLEAITP